MKFNRFRITVTLLSLLLGITSFVFVWTLDKDYLVIGKVLIALAWFIELQALINYVNRTNKTLTTFLESLKSADFVRKEGMSESISKLNLTYNQIINIVKHARLEQESQYQYFQHTLEHISTGIISFNSTGKIDIFNKAAQSLLGLSNINNINELERIKEGLSNKIANIKSKKEHMLILNNSQEEKHILIKASKFTLLNRQITLLSLQDIKFELDTKEQNAWQKLIRVLTHEIMNSAGPMKSLANTTLKSLLKNNSPKKVNDIDDELIEDAVLSLQTIQERNDSLNNFVISYKKLIKAPTPNKTILQTKDLLQNIEQLFKEDFKKHQIEYKSTVSENARSLLADKELLSQVIINLLKNAIESLQNAKDKSISVKVHSTNSLNFIEIKDNGSGISDEIAEQIFTPFFTTKKDGDGIGLSLSKQIIQAHDGDILVSSVPNKGTTVKIKLPVIHH